MIGLYDLIDLGLPEAAISAWLSGHDLSDMVDGVDLPPLSPRERRQVADAWWFIARPGQLWRPGVEFITDHQCGRGWGKDRAISEFIVGKDCAGDPERWGGYAIVVGPDPTQVKRDCLFGPSGIFGAAKRASASGNGPAIVEQNLNDRWLRFAAPRGGGGGGLTVYWAASSDPKSVHGANVGLVWWDEFGVSYHRKRDEQGNNAWGALRPAIRLGPDPKVIITQTPSRAPEVRALWRDAERPECPRCRDAWTLERGPWRGEVGREPWRLPRSEQRRVHPLLNTRTTEPSRECPACGTSITAEVRIVFGDTRDNPAIAARARADADRAIKSGAAHAHLAFAPRGEADASPQGALVRHEDVRMVEARWPDLEAAARRGQVPDPWMAVLGSLGAEEVVVVADPAVTSKEGSDETGVVASCRCPAPSAGGGDDGAADDEPDGLARAVGLQDASVRPDEVDGAPSATWAPRAYWLACCWGARRIVVETNNGGDEVLAVVRDLCARGLRESEVMARLREDLPELAGVPDARLSVLARRVAASSRGIAVESVGRRARKPVRLGWYGATAQMGRQALACVDRLGGAEHWRQALGQMTDYEQPAGGATDDKIDRGDAVCSAAQVVLGVRETHRGEVDDPALGGSGWMDRVAGALAR